MRFCRICGAPSGTCNDASREISRSAGLTVTRLPALREVNQEMARTLIATKTYWFNADRTEALPDGHADAAFLLVRKGSPVDPQVAEHYGIETEVSGGDMLTPMPGANVQQEANRQRMEATRRITAEVGNTISAAQDAATGRQVAGMIEGRVAKEVGGSVAASGASMAGTGQAMPSSQAEALKELKERSLSGSDLLTGTRAEESKAYDERPAGVEAGANPTPSEQKSAGGNVPSNQTRTAEIAPPPEAGAKTGDNLQPGTQEYTSGVGVAATPPGMERADKTQSPPAPLGEAPAQSPPPLPATPQSANPAVDKTLPEALEEEGVKPQSPPSGV
jgi:hypothetical protein